MSEEQHSVKTQRDQGMEELLANLAGADISNALTMPNSVAIEFHPYSRLFPLMEGCELAGLVADIQENGLRVPIVLLGNRILDGRNRYRACMEAGIRPVFEQYTGDDPLGNVLSANLHRRHLTESQRGMVASALATMRQGARTDIAQVCAMSQEQAAKRLAVSRRTVQYACTVREQGIPELVRRAERGEINVSLAARIAKMPQEQQRRVTALDPAALRGAVKQAVPADRKIAAPPFTPNTDDIVLWANEQARALRAAGQTSTNRAIDWENVAQAIEALGKNSSSDLANCIPTVLLHLVKLDIAAWDHGGKAAWRKKIDHARNEIRRLLAAAPSLQPTVRGVIGATLDGAKEVALKQLHVGKRRVIDLAGLSYTQEQVIDDWFPELPPKQLSEDPYAAERITQTAASKVGLRAHKSTLRRNNLGGFQLIDRASAVVAGEKFDLTEKQVLEICANRREMMMVEEREKGASRSLSRTGRGPQVAP